MTVSVIRQTRSMSNQICHLDVAGTPPRIGVPLDIRMSPEFGLHCHKSTFGKCCCLPISQTWHMNCKEAKAWLVSKGYIDANGRGPNQVCAGGVGMNRVMRLYCPNGATGSQAL